MEEDPNSIQFKWEDFKWITPKLTLQIIVISMAASIVLNMNIIEGWELVNYVGSALAIGLIIEILALCTVGVMMLFFNFKLPERYSWPIGIIAAMALPSLCISPFVLWWSYDNLTQRANDARELKIQAETKRINKIIAAENLIRENEETIRRTAFFRISLNANSAGSLRFRVPTLATSAIPNRFEQ